MKRPILVSAIAVGIAGLAAYPFLFAGGGTGAPLVTVMAPPLTSAGLEGKQAFDESCAGCHGENAAGQDGVAPPLVHRLYVPGHHSDAAIFNAALNGVRAHHWPFGDMPPVERITRGKLELIVAYVRTVQRANGIR
jgi:mono/diheme cytochrome c family protein